MQDERTSRGAELRTPKGGGAASISAGGTENNEDVKGDEERTSAPPLDEPRRGIPVYIRYVRKALVEEGHSIVHLSNIYQQVLRHETLFYPWRHSFVHSMVQVLAKLGLPHQSTVELKRLSIELAGIILRWEQRHQQEVAAKRAAGEHVDEPHHPHSAAARAAPVAEAPLAQVGQKRTVQGLPAAGSEGTGAATARESETGAGSAGTGAAAGDERPAKLLRTDAGATPGPESNAAAGTEATPQEQAEGTGQAAAAVASGGPTATATPAATPAAAPSASRPHDISDIVINFLVRMVFTLRETRDRERSSEHDILYQSSLELIGQALSAWPEAPIRLQYFQRLLVKHSQDKTVAPGNILNAGLGVMARLLEKQGPLYIPTCRTELHLALIHAYSSVQLGRDITAGEEKGFAEISESLAAVCKGFASVYPLRQPGADRSDLPAEVVEARARPLALS